MTVGSRPTAVAAVLIALVGCRDPMPATSSPDDASVTDGADATRSSSGPTGPAAPAPSDAADGGLIARKLPRIEYRGGPFLRHPKIVTITFAMDDPKLVARVEQLGSTITRSAWWKTVTEGYCATEGDCIGEGSAAPPMRLAEPLGGEVRDTEIEATLMKLAKAKRLGTVDKDTLLLVYLPKDVALTDATTRYCGSGHPRALHRAVEIDGTRIPFAIIPRCGDEAELTGTASHEILESVTNVFPAEHGFAFVGGSPASGFVAAGIEPVDPCGLITMDGHWTIESGFVVHRAWSNRAASLARDPCVPSRTSAPYAMLVPREPAVRLPKEGESVTVELDASAASLTTPWAVSAFDLSGHQDGVRYVDLSLDKHTVSAGETVKLTITSIKKNPKQREIVGVVSTVGVHSHMWPLLVMMR